MQLAKLDDMVKGWFVGHFKPTLIDTNDVEVAVKYYKAGDAEASHYHKLATEITVIVSGEVMMNGAVYAAGDIIVIEPLEETDFIARTDAATAVVKFPGASNDKYPGSGDKQC